MHMRKKVKQKGLISEMSAKANMLSERSMMTEQEERMYRKEQSILTHNNFRHRQAKNPQTRVAQDEELMQIRCLNQSSVDQITQYINKLISKNKINTKNAFDIPLIHLQQMEEYQSSLNEHTWKRISSTLENDYKIYGYRVDAAHNITFKMVESIARHQNAADGGAYAIGINNDGELGAQVQNGDPSSAVNRNSHQNSKYDVSMSGLSKSKLNVDYMRFIEKNMKALNVGQVESFFNYNPALQRNKRKFDQQGLKGLLLNNISMTQKGELKLDDSQQAIQQKAKKQPIQAEIALEFQNFQRQEELFSMAFGAICQNPDIPQPQSLPRLEQQQIGKGIFETIFKFNILNSGSIKSNDLQIQFGKILKAYKIISGQQRQDKKRLKKKNEKEKEGQGIQLEVDNKNELNQKGLQQSHEKDQQQETQKQHQQQQQNDNVLGQEGQGKNENMNQRENLNSELNAQQNSHNQATLLQRNQLENEQRIVQEENPVPQQIDDAQLLLLNNKKFDLLQMKVNGEEQSPQEEQQSSLSNLQQQSEMINIDSYISIRPKNFKRKRRAAASSIDGLSTDEIGQKLFNRKTACKKRKIQTNCKDQEQQRKKQLVQKTQRQFRERLMAKIQQRQILKRSTVFKKVSTEDKIFNDLRTKLKERTERYKIEREKRRRTRKKIKTQLSSIPVYDFQKNDGNRMTFADEIKLVKDFNTQQDDQQFDQQINSTQHYPYFITQLSELKKKKLDQKKRLWQQQQQERQRQKQSFLQLNQTVVDKQGQTQQQEYQHPEQQPVQQQQQQINPQECSSEDESDGSQNKNLSNQLTIRQTKDKLQKVMSHCLKRNRKKFNRTSNNSGNHNTLSFKSIYKQYVKKQGSISPALCFLTVLHLANQHDFVLQDQQNQLDFKVSVTEVEEIRNNNDVQETCDHNNVDSKVLQIQQHDQDASQMIELQQQQSSLFISSKSHIIKKE